MTCNGYPVPLLATDNPDVQVGGVRYRAWQPPSALHPTITVDGPLRFELVDMATGTSRGGCTYHVSHPGGRSYDSPPVNAVEAESRRGRRFEATGFTPGQRRHVRHPGEAGTPVHRRGRAGHLGSAPGAYRSALMALPAANPHDIDNLLAGYRTARAQETLFDRSVAARCTGYDEFVDAAGNVRPSWQELAECVGERGRAGLERLRGGGPQPGRQRRHHLHPGRPATVTPSPTATGSAMPGPWHLDALPLVISATDWDTLEAGLVQRSRLLDAVLTDLYGARRSVTSGVLPPQLLFAHPGYIRAARGIEVPGRHQLFMHGCDVSRAADGAFLVNADWTQAPSGAGYALADRRVVAHAIPDLYERIGPAPGLAVGAGAAAGADRRRARSPPRSRWSSCSARASTPRPRSTRPIWRACWVSRWWRAPTWWCATASCGCGRWAPSSGSTWCCAGWTPTTPIRSTCAPDSRLGVVGLVEVLRRGAVTVVNTLGSGILESPGLLRFLPELAERLLGETPLLQTAPVYWGGIDTERSHLLTQAVVAVDQARDRRSRRSWDPRCRPTQREELARPHRGHPVAVGRPGAAAVLLGAHRLPPGRAVVGQRRHAAVHGVAARRLRADDRRTRLPAGAG